MSERITVVCGFPRSGTSLVMRMLHAAGMPVHAENLASFEHPDILGLPSDSEWLESCVGKAVKILDPQIHTPPKGHAYNFIWMERDRTEQARSTVKFMRAIGVAIDTSNQTVKAIARSLKKDNPKCLRLLERYPRSRLLRVRFENVLRDPEFWSKIIAELCDLSPEAMPGVVVQRSPECLPTMLEMRYARL